MTVPRATLVALGGLFLGACASNPGAQAGDEPVRPLPTSLLAGARVTVYPITMLLAEADLGWDAELMPRREALDRADGLIADALTQRSPEVTWVLPETLRRAARQAPGMLPDPDHMGTATLRSPGIQKLPDPLRSQLRVLTAAAGNRFALIPASLFFFADSTGADMGRAELTLVLADVRSGDIRWRTVARGVSDEVWAALRRALASLTPGLPG